MRCEARGRRTGGGLSRGGTAALTPHASVEPHRHAGPSRPGPRLPWEGVEKDRVGERFVAPMGNDSVNLGAGQWVGRVHGTQRGPVGVGGEMGPGGSERRRSGLGARVG